MGKKRAATTHATRVSVYRGPVEQSWQPYVDGSLSLFALEHVGYEGLQGPSALFAARDVEDVGAFLKVHFGLFESLGLETEPHGRERKRFAKKHDLVGSDDFDGPEEEWAAAWAEALAGEPDGDVARLLTSHVDDDDEGAYCSLVEIDDGRWVETAADRAAWFAPIRTGERKLFQICASEALSKATSLFVRARTRAEVFRRIVDPDPDSIFARSLALLLDVERFPGAHEEMTAVKSASPKRPSAVDAELQALAADLKALPDTDGVIARMLEAAPLMLAHRDARDGGELSGIRRKRIDAMSDAQLEACFDHAYTKGDFASVSVAEAPVPYWVHPSGIASR